MDFDRISVRSPDAKEEKKISMAIADSFRCFYPLVHFAKYVKT